MTTDTKITTPKIYVACLAAYSRGILHGAWIDATQPSQKIWAEIYQMLRNSPSPDAEEWAVHDSEGLGIDIGEYPSIEEVREYAVGIVTSGAAYGKYARWRKETSEEAATQEHFEDCFEGYWENAKEFALRSEVVEERYGYSELSEFWKNHVDWDSVADEIFMEDYHAESATPYGIYVFKTDYY